MRFNTSHVTLYLKNSNGGRHTRFVSIHLMLLFIQFTQDIFNSDYRFNTSHVTLYPAPHFPLALCTPCFNTSHVTLYPKKIFRKCTIISCFNTSHVTLYLKDLQKITLSKSVSIHLMLLFIITQSHLVV